MKTRSIYTLIVLAILAVISVVAYYFAISYVSGLSEKTHTASSDLSYVEAKYQQAISQRAVANTGESSGKKLDKYILATDGEVGIVKELERLANNLSLEIVTEVLEVEQDEALATHSKNYLHIIVTTNGAERDTRRFLALLETLPYNVKIKEVNLYNGQSGSQWQGRFDLSIVKNNSVTTQ